MTTARDLNPDDYMTYMVGKAARLEVQLEGTVREVWRHLAGYDGLAKWGAPKSLIQLVDGARAMLAKADQPVRIVESGDAALLAARKAHELRNTLVHEGWVLDPDGGWRRGKDYLVRTAQAKPVWKISDFEEAIQSLLRADERVFSLMVIVDGTGNEAHRGHQASDLLIMEDHFEFTEEGDVAVIFEGDDLARAIEDLSAARS